MREITPMSDEELRENARAIMTQAIGRSDLGAKLTDDERTRAVEIAVDAWQGNLTIAHARDIGIKHAKI